MFEVSRGAGAKECGYKRKFVGSILSRGKVIFNIFISLLLCQAKARCFPEFDGKWGVQENFISIEYNKNNNCLIFMLQYLDINLLCTPLSISLILSSTQRLPERDRSFSDKAAFLYWFICFFQYNLIYLFL